MGDAGPHDPTERDVDEALRLQAIVDGTGLCADRAGPVRCDGCRYYLNPKDALAYCWHPELRILVDGSWRCRHHDPADEMSV